MIAGHYATALVAKQHAPTGHIAYFLFASQAPDLIWYALMPLGLPHTHTHGGPVNPAMWVSHDLVPLLLWTGMAIVIGRLLFGRWKPGWVGGVLVAGHEVADLLSGFPHNIAGPDTMEVGLGLYFTAPRVAVAIELLFAVALVAWVVLHDRRRGRRRSAWTYGSWALVFGLGIAMSFQTVPTLTDVDPNATFATETLVVTVGIYLLQLAVLWWGDRRAIVALGPAQEALT